VKAPTSRAAIATTCKPMLNRGWGQTVVPRKDSLCGMTFMTIRSPVSYVLSLVLMIVACSCASSSSEKAVGIEQARYSVIEKEGKFEIRQYEPCIVTETLVESNFAGAGNVAFRRLFNYISGQNRQRESIAMTAPVNQQARSEKIAMTAPVNQQKP
jgi:hypothetical protein